MRIFVAVVPPPEVGEDLADFLAARRTAPGAPRWAADDQFHLTLAFVADAAPARVDDADAALQEVCAGVTPASLTVAGSGVFPDVTRARVLWAGVRGGDRLEPLALRIRHALAGHGIACAGGDLVPHVTLGRWRTPVDATRWLRVLDTYTGPPWTPDEIELIASRLGQGRGGHPAYETIATYALGPAGS